MIYTFFSTMAILSMQPHQEPRFLAALLALFIIFVANSGNLLHAGRVFWVSATYVAYHIS